MNEAESRIQQNDAQHEYDPQNEIVEDNDGHPERTTATETVISGDPIVSADETTNKRKREDLEEIENGENNEDLNAKSITQQDAVSTKSTLTKIDNSSLKLNFPQSRAQESASLLGSMGGDIKTPAFALLAGCVLNTTACSIPITVLPVVFGRTHNTSDPKFISLGKHKNISRHHFTIYYRDLFGGKIHTTLSSKKNVEDIVTYEAPESTSVNKTVIQSESEESDRNNLPPGGFFAIECLGKNKIAVDGRKIAQGQVAILKDRSTILLSTHSLYFLLPLLEGSPKSMKIPNPHYSPALIESNQELEANTPNKKPKTEKNSVTKRLPLVPKICSEFDNLPVSSLLSQMTQAILSNQWTKRHSILGSIISFHAVRDAAAAPEMHKLSAKSGTFSVSRADIMKWIDDSPQYGTWAAQMLSRIEIKSYQSNIGKSLVRAGYNRTGSIGRHAKWSLPEDLAPKSKLEELRKSLFEKDSKDDAESNDENDENNIENNNENDNDNGDNDDESQTGTHDLNSQSQSNEEKEDAESNEIDSIEHEPKDGDEGENEEGIKDNINDQFNDDDDDNDDDDNDDESE